MADNASLARPYAKAVFELAQESGSFDGWTSALEQAAVISQDSGFNGLITDPRVDRDRLADLLIDLIGDSLPAGGRNLIQLLVQNDRLGALADIASQYTELVARAKQSVNAEVITAMALTDVQKSALAVALESRLGLKVNLEETVDAGLIGGAIIKAGDLVIDGSAKGRIEKLTSALLR